MADCRDGSRVRQCFALIVVVTVGRCRFISPQGASLRRVVFRKQLGYRHFGDSRVSDVTVAIGEGKLGCFNQRVIVANRLFTQRREIETLENVKRE